MMLAMSAHVIQNPVPTPEQMAEMLGVSRARVEALRGIMRSQGTTAYSQRKRATSVSAMKKASADRKSAVAGMKKDAARAKTKAR